jgi:MoaA/NifB/PqqE/SkfB family radical SAM enzyme|tara:strand:+ start:12 stop:908 length:897 start_codon:yes stop_codon:yes gene_type:complete
MEDIVKGIGNVDFELTYLCNLECLHCYNPSRERVNELETEKVKSITKEVREVGFKEIHYNGGEPLIRKDIYEILEFAGKTGLETLLETNATLLTDPGRLKAIPGLKIRASIDGSKRAHNEIRRSKNGLDVYSRALQNLRKAKEVGLPVQLTCSVNGINYKEIYGMVEEISEYGLENVRLRLSMPTGFATRNWRSLALSMDCVEELERQVESIKHHFPHIDFKDSTLIRGIPKFEPRFFIDPRGLVKPYPFIEYFAGDLREDSVEDVLGRIPSFNLPKEDEKTMVDYLSSLGMINGGQR